jgi:hypothetical protein
MSVSHLRLGRYASRFTRGRACNDPGVSGNQTAKWKPGQSGNPKGKSRLRQRFEETFNEALLTQGGPEEAARLLWQAARQREPWAIQELCRRFAPEAASLHLVHEVQNHEFDYGQLSDEQLQQLEAILGPSTVSLIGLQAEKARRCRPASPTPIWTPRSIRSRRSHLRLPR